MSPTRSAIASPPSEPSCYEDRPAEDDDVDLGVPDPVQGTLENREFLIASSRATNRSKIPRACGAVRAGQVVSEQKVGFRPTVALQAFAPGHHMPHSCVPRSQKLQSAARTCGFRDTEGGPRADCKPGSYFANSNPPQRIQDDIQRHAATRMRLGTKWVVAPKAYSPPTAEAHVNILEGG